MIHHANGSRVESEFDKYFLYNGKLVSKDHPVFHKKVKIIWPRVILLAATLIFTTYVLAWAIA